jgi:putative oxidoreductase
MLGIGLATPLAAASLAGVMLTALRKAIWKDGIKTGEGGYEMLLLVTALALAESGPGPCSLDAMLKSERRGTRWAAAALIAGAAGSALATELGSRLPASAEEEPHAEETGVSPVAAGGS